VRAAAAALLLLAGVAGAAPPDLDAAARDARELLGKLVAADTTNPPGNEARASVIGEAWLRARGISYESHEFAPGRRNLIARVRGDGSARPLLILAHTDVVGAAGQTWETEPFRMTPVDGHLVGRGVQDDLGMAALALEVLGLLHDGKVPLARDVIVAWTGDEETGGAGIQFALAEHRGAIDAELALNEGGGILVDDAGRPLSAGVQVAEKLYQDYVVRATGPTGHSSTPPDENAITRLSAGLARVGRHRFPARVLAETRPGLLARAQGEEGRDPRLAAALRAVARAAGKGPLPAGPLAVVEKNPSLRALLRTTCVATMIAGGTKANALPADAYATINCRILPDEKPSDVQAALAQALGDPALEVRAIAPLALPARASPIEGPAMAAVLKVMGEMYPGVPVTPAMSTGATDSLFLRAAGIQAYGFMPIGMTQVDARRAHGVGERIREDALRSGLEILYRVVVEVAGKR
jgi:acetylornithine deacetylase/succinyl-diaminopimelate desuccinylase-like protein